MAKLIAYNFITLNGYYKGANEDITWHKHGEEESKYSEDMLARNNILVFGRKTFEHMASFWPMPFARDMFPVVADGMNKAEKLVLSTNAFLEISWENTKVISGDVVEKMTMLKQTSPKDMAILGSGSIISLFSDSRLIDEYQIMVDPVAIPSGTSIFTGMRNNLNLQLTSTRTFKSGVVLLNYSLIHD
jgi:dihydrofolate reductase